MSTCSRFLERGDHVEVWFDEALISTEDFLELEWKDKLRFLYREDGPSVIWQPGLSYYTRYGELHRENGPAIIYPNKKDYKFYLQGVRYSLNEWLEQLDISTEEKVALKMVYSGIDTESL